MDNLTHSLVGVALARIVVRDDPGGLSKTARAAILTGVLGSNFPDLDFLFRYVGSIGGGGSHSDYLLFHRGYTHTFLAALPEGLIAAATSMKLAGVPLRGFQLLKLAFLGVIAVLMHIFMDWWNSYGVHPFYPISNQWFYGDRIFILEPLLWFCMLPFAFHTIKQPLWRAWLLGFWSLALGLIWSTGLFLPAVSLAVTLWALAFILLQKGHWRLAYSGAGVLLVVAGFSIASARARMVVEEQLHQQVNQIALSPTPSNPFCWRVWTLGVEPEASEKFYVGRTGIVSLIPQWISPQVCEILPFSYRSLTEVVVTARLPKSSENLRWKGEFRRPLQEFQRLAYEDCDFSAYLLFSRLPMWWEERGGLVVGDLRFGGGQALFRTRLGSQSENCPRDLPPWEPPTRDLLMTPSGS